ncbi:MAG: hypothetical protein NC343_08160 [Muribaculum sp.]|nr:hypothetical protein [Muribaculaceae bacterium]MCM1081710.1 hypothetical protein [Muribaculum sp.]
MSTRYLSNAVVHNGELYRNSIVSINAKDEVCIERFIEETPETIFISGIVCVCNSQRVTDNHRKALNHIVESSHLMETAIRKVREYMTIHSLYMNLSPDSTPMLLPLKRLLAR